jgi:hypothetical protein
MNEITASYKRHTYNVQPRPVTLRNTAWSLFKMKHIMSSNVCVFRISDANGNPKVSAIPLVSHTILALIFQNLNGSILYFAFV